MRKQIIREVFAFLRDHYWDSLEDQRNILEAHFNACERILNERQAEGSSSQPPADFCNTKIIESEGPFFA